jgi:hypothetical protein
VRADRGVVRRLHGSTAPGVPRWAVLTACAVPLTVLPSGIWRIVVILTDETQSGRDDVPAWLPMPGYVLVLSIASELLALMAVGLVATWGEVWPRWIPLLRGRPVPVLAAVVPAAFGALALTVLWTSALGTIPAGVTLTGEPTPADFPTEAGGWEAFFFWVAYAPLLLWGPLLAVLTVHYHRRRRGWSSSRPATARSGSSSVR